MELKNANHDGYKVLIKNLHPMFCFVLKNIGNWVK